MTTTVSLGPYTLESFEIPNAIRYGGRQRLAVHDLPGGGRLTDVLGGSDNDIVFGGIISGSDADTKAQLLDALRISGLTVPLFWSEQYFIVIVAEAQFDYRKPWWIPYQLRCSVQSNLVYGIAATALSAATSIVTDLASAAGLLATVPATLSSAQAAISAIGGTTLGTGAYGQSVATVTAAQTDLSENVTNTGAALPEFDLGLYTTEPASAAAAVTSITGTSGQLASLTAARGFVGRGLSTLKTMDS